MHLFLTLKSFSKMPFVAINVTVTVQASSTSIDMLTVVTVISRKIELCLWFWSFKKVHSQKSAFAPPFEYFWEFD